MPRYQHIMLAVDFNKEAPFLINTAVERARAEQSKLSAIHIDNSIAAPYHQMVEIDLDEYCQVSDLASAKSLKDLLELTDYPVEPHVLCGTNFAAMITNAIQKHSVDLLIMGHHRYSWLGDIFSSASESIVRKMPCDILLIKV